MGDFGRSMATTTAKCTGLLKTGTALVSDGHLLEGYISAYKASFNYF
jgi:hypothetical protein